MVLKFAHPLMGDTTEARQRATYAYVGVFTSLATLVMSLRLYIRIKAKTMGPEDYVILLTWIFATIHSGLVINELKNGLGMHMKDIPPLHIENLMRSFYFILIVYPLTIGTFKASILLQYFRIFYHIQPFLRICYVSIIFVIMFTLSFVIVAIFQCRPIYFFWDRMIPGGGTCLDPAKVWVTANAINILTDMFIFILPLPILYKLTFPRRIKYGLMVVFALGLFVVLMSIIRLPSVYLICTSADLTWDSVPSTIWTIIELNTAIICASMPALRILGMNCLQGFLNTTRKLVSGLTGSPMHVTSTDLSKSAPIGLTGQKRNPDVSAERVTIWTTISTRIDDDDRKKRPGLEKSSSSTRHLTSESDIYDGRPQS